MMREATPADRPALLAFLRGHESRSMFPLVNLATLSGAPMRAWIAGDPVHGMIGLTDHGFLMPQWPDGDWPAARAALAGQRITGLIGPAEQVRALKSVLHLTSPDFRHDREEPGFTLALEALRMPDLQDCTLRPLTLEDSDEIIGWRIAYNAETFDQPAQGGQDKAAAEVAHWLRRDTHRVLWQGNRRVALTGFNARLPDVVQVGGVFTPPALRGHGHARRAVALHLTEARTEGARRAHLFAASDAAERAYRALGFQPTARMCITLLHQPKVLP